MHYAVPTVLATHGHLERYYTDWYLPDSGWAGNLRNYLLYSPIKSMRRIAMRFNANLPENLVKAFPLLGLGYALSLRMSVDEASRERVYARYGRKFGESIINSGFGESAVVYGMNTASLELFQAASVLRKACVLEQSIAPYIIMKRLLHEESQLWLDWEPGNLSHINTQLIERERREWDLSNLILAGSDFVKNSLLTCGISEKKCIVLPYAMDVMAYKTGESEKKDGVRLHVLFLGSVGLRKGIQYLYQALGMIKTTLIDAKAAGMISLSSDAVRRVEQRVQLLGLVPRAETLILWEWADVLVLPSICEGSALVTYEALASGVPVITTPNSGSPVQDGVTGFVVPNRNAEAIAERLEQLARDPDLRREMSINARKYAEEHLSWDAYSMRLISALESVLG